MRITFYKEVGYPEDMQKESIKFNFSLVGAI